MTIKQMVKELIRLNANLQEQIDLRDGHEDIDRLRLASGQIKAATTCLKKFEEREK